MPSRPETARRTTLGIIAFVATVVLLFGLAAIAGGLGNAAGTLGPTVDPPGGQGPVTASASAPEASGDATLGGTPSPPAPTDVPSLAPSGDPVLIGAGDIATCDGTADSATAALLVGQDGTVFTAGDNAYQDGSLADFERCYGPTWGRELGRTRPAPGNHDHQTSGLAGYLGYFGAAAAPQGDAWYSYDLGTWHVIVLDGTCAAAGGCDGASPQGLWLAADLAASSAACTLAIWHQPRFSSGEHGDDPSVGPFWEALYAAGADLIVNGHDHDYERFAPQDPGGVADPDRGLREFVVGTGGAPLRAFGDQAANSELRVTGYHGVIRLTLRPGRYDWSFLTTAGPTIDAGSAACH